MTTASEHAQALLSAIIPDRRDLLDKALRHLSPEHFPDRVLQKTFEMLERYADRTGAVLTRNAVGDILTAARQDAGTVAVYLETYDLLASRQTDEAGFRWAMDQLRELSAERATSAALTESMQILTKGVEGERGVQLRGHVDARTHLLQRMAEIDRTLSMQEAPEGDMGKEGDDILAEYAARESARLAGRSVGIEFGIPALDASIGGLKNGDLVLVVGSTGEGKSHQGVQLAFNAAVEQQRNVVFLTSETVRSQIRRRMIARHSVLPHFDINPDPGTRRCRGINSRDLRDATLTAAEKQQLYQVVADSDNNPGYGRRYICQIPRAATMAYIESKLARLQRMFNIDLVIIDSLYLLKADKRRTQVREELSEILKEAKQLATTHNDGLGVPIVSPWQVSRTARDEAERTGFYTPAALSETAEASNSPDVILSLLAPLNHTSRYATLRMQVMKNRDGERASAIEVEVDYATSTFRAPMQSQGLDALGPDSLGLLN